MILQALTRHYEDLLQRRKIDGPGWSRIKISFALCLSADGELTMVIPTLREVERNGKTVLNPQEMSLPSAIKRSSDISANFLWDNATYLLGIDQKGASEHSRKCFAASAALHHAILDGIDAPAARAILAFFDTWKPEQAAQHPALAGLLGRITKGANLLFRFDCAYPQEDHAIRDAWQRYRGGGTDDAVRMQCLVTGALSEIPATHPAIKGVRNTRPSGAALVTFNALAFCSYGREQNYNAPVGSYAAFAYTAALNHLLADRDSVQFIGDATVVCWAEGADPDEQNSSQPSGQEEAALDYQDFALAGMFGKAIPTLTDNDLRAALRKLANNHPCEEFKLDPNRPFYILGLSPNSSRLSVRFFMCDTFGRLMRNVNDHYERLEMIRPSFVKPGVLLPQELLRETINPKAKNKTPSPAMAGAVSRAIFSGDPYPPSLLEAVLMRIRAERKITWGRASILKAYYLRNPNPDCPKEVLTVSLNEASTNPAYTLGRLFSVYEAAQEAANPGVNASIKDRYFNSASAMPASIFPILNNLYQKHLRKLNIGERVYYDKQVAALKGVLGESYPVRMNLAQQGAFDLGYYHQTQKRYTKKEEAKND